MKMGNDSLILHLDALKAQGGRECKNKGKIDGKASR
jgi:hypothetical protein